jgi:hypothetical protein
MKVTQKNVLSHFKNVSQKDARIIVRLCNGTIDLESFPEAQRRIRECYNRPDNTDITLNVVNKMINGYGVESCEYESNALYSRDFISYVNMGDTYATTILYNPETCRFEISDWGSLYETSPAWAAQNEIQEEEY